MVIYSRVLEIDGDIDIFFVSKKQFEDEIKRTLAYIFDLLW